MSPKFSLGSEVMSKKLGVPAIAKVVGVVEGRIWHNLHIDDPGSTSSFNRVYPKWVDRHAYYLEFSSDVKPLSIDQYEEEQDAGNCYCEGDYNDIQTGRIFVYPEEDLEIWDL